jgi:hypothetical protein
MILGFGALKQIVQQLVHCSSRLLKSVSALAQPYSAELKSALLADLQ